MATEVDFSGAEQVLDRWTHCRTGRPAAPGRGSGAAEPPGTGAAGAAPSVTAPADAAVYAAIRENLIGGLRELQLCGLSGRCLRDDIEAIDRGVERQRRRIFARLWLGRGLRAYRYSPARRAWRMGSVPRRQARAYLRSYFRPLTDPVEFEAWLERLAAGGGRFDLTATPLLELRDLTEEELLHPAIVLAAVQEDGRAVQKALRLLRKVETGGPHGVGFVLESGATPVGLYILDFLEFVDVSLFLLHLHLYLLVPATLRRGSRDALGRAVAFTYGVAALASVPLLTLYHNAHGSAVVEEVEPALARSATVAAAAAEARADALLPLLGPEATDALRTVWRETLALREHNACRMLDRAVGAADGRILIGPSSVPDETVELDVRLAGDETARLSIRPDIQFGRGWAANREIYWMRDDLWARFRAAGLLVNQAGARLYVTAASNRWGGRHPPHSTHRDGEEIDLDWGYHDAALDRDVVVPDLQRMRRKYYPADRPEGAFYDPRKRRTFDFVPSGRDAPRTHQAFDALATWVVMQALPFAGFTRFLYSDTRNMVEALAHLRRAFPDLPVPAVWPAEPRTSRPRPPVSEEALVEPAGHFNHLHAEAAAASPYDTDVNALRIAGPILTRLHELALERDADPAFRRRFFPGADEQSGPRQRWEAWAARSADGQLALLPVWRR